MKKFLSAALSAAILGCMMTAPVYAVEPVVSMGKDIECAPGQTLQIPISISAENNFESAEMKLYLDNNDLSMIKDIKAGSNKVLLETFNKDDHVNLVFYGKGGKALADGDILMIELSVPDTDGSAEYGLTLKNKVFALVESDYNIDDIKLHISANKVLGDANGDGKLNVRDCANIAKLLAKLNSDPSIKLPLWADYNKDGVVNVRDCVAIAKKLAMER